MYFWHSGVLRSKFNCQYPSPFYQYDTLHPFSPSQAQLHNLAKKWPPKLFITRAPHRLTIRANHREMNGSWKCYKTPLSTRTHGNFLFFQMTKCREWSKSFDKKFERTKTKIASKQEKQNCQSMSISSSLLPKAFWRRMTVIIPWVDLFYWNDDLGLL